jgi:leucyl/phenylalanyl-tRNA--protein transferase
MNSVFDEDFILPALSRHSFLFPDPQEAPREGLLAYGGDLSPNRLLMAYRKGIFPWYSEGDPILWWSPDPRLLLYPQNFKVRKSFRRVLRNAGFRVTFDREFARVIHLCGHVPREGQNGSWILPEMEEAYIDLHHQGYAHSVEVYRGGELVGGLYGLSLGRAFFGESMFSLVNDASKVAFKALSDVLAERGYDFIDCQMKTDHMVRLGAETVPRERFLKELAVALEEPDEIGSWQHFQWEYKDKKNNGT